MTKIKLCGMTRHVDIAAVNEIKPDYIGFVLWEPSKRYVSKETAAELKKMLDPDIKAAGVFVNENPETVATIANEGIIDLIQLHGDEDDDYIGRLRKLTDKPVIQAIRIVTEEDTKRAEHSPADHILLDSGKGGGKTIDWDLAAKIKRPYFLAGGLTTDNVGPAVEKLHPYAVDVSSGIETDGHKDPAKMQEFSAMVQSAERRK
ncbi:MAG: phosphoribosylanthranilate isomerase [Lachnospiraceae bacterium]|nr:phosphoribosylanthranilate isomerase [Lachnospiraceae bacterium]